MSDYGYKPLWPEPQNTAAFGPIADVIFPKIRCVTKSDT